MKKVLSFLVGLLLVSSSAGATIILDDWTLDLTGVDGIGAEKIENVSSITYVGVAHIENPSYNPVTGEAYGLVDGLLNATSFQDKNQATIASNVDTSAYQLTFDFSVDNYNPDLFANPGTFTHVAPNFTDGLLDIWVDGPDNGFTQAIGGLGSGFQDGVQIAQFEIIPGDGGVFTVATRDGSDDASFSLVWALPGIFFDKNGNDLALLGDALVAITDSNLDADPNNVGGFNVGGGPGDYLPNLEANWAANSGFTYDSTGTPFGFFVEEDGSARLAVVPEPSTFVLLFAGLIGLGFIGRKKVKKD